MSKLYYPAVLHEAEKTEQGYWIEFPDLPGCISEGDTLEETITMAKKAIGTWFMPNPLNPNQEMPMPSKPIDIKLDHPSDCVVLIEYDSIAWAKIYNNRAVKKTLTIPAWLNELAEKKDINYSQVLKEALMRKLEIE